MIPISNIADSMIEVVGQRLRLIKRRYLLQFPSFFCLFPLVLASSSRARHTLRHWKATMLYHQTKDILYVKNFLGHKKIKNTMLYIQLAVVLFEEASDQFTVRVASKPEEITKLLEVGYP